MITGTLCFIGGIFFAAAFPTPSAVIRGTVTRWVNAVRTRIGL